MQRAVWRDRYGATPKQDCWLHSVHFHDNFPKACIVVGDGPELVLKWVPMNEVRIVHRLPVSLEED